MFNKIFLCFIQAGGMVGPFSLGMDFMNDFRDSTPLNSSFGIHAFIRDTKAQFSFKVEGDEAWEHYHTNMNVSRCF